jgi:hypothetical protein
VSNLAQNSDRPPLILPAAVDVGALADAVAERIIPLLPSGWNTNPEGYIGTTEALEWLGWGEKGYDRLLKLCRADGIPHFRVGARLYFQHSALDEWIHGGQR